MIHLYVAVGGMLGALARFAAGGWVMTWAAPGFPWGTFAVNVSGSLLLGLTLQLLPPVTASPALRAFLAVGLLGGFTTFSTFDYETFSLLQAGSYGTAIVYSLGSIGSCVLGVFAGFTLGNLARGLTVRSTR